jgi:hypothetical protein
MPFQAYSSPIGKSMVVAFSKAGNIHMKEIFATNYRALPDHYEPKVHLNLHGACEIRKASFSVRDLCVSGFSAIGCSFTGTTMVMPKYQNSHLGQ